MHAHSAHENVCFLAVSAWLACLLAAANLCDRKLADECEQCAICLRGCTHLVKWFIILALIVSFCCGAIRKPHTCCRDKRAQDERDAEARRYHKDMSTLTVKASTLGARSTSYQVLLNPDMWYVTVRQSCSRCNSHQLLWIRIYCYIGQLGLD